jgi:hypothetical protein
MQDSEFCFMHSPEHTDEAAEARRLGGLRRRKEATISGIFDFDGLRSVDDILRVLEIAVQDTLSLENSVARNRTLAYLASVALKGRETGELEERIKLLEVAVRQKQRARERRNKPRDRSKRWPGS